MASGWLGSESQLLLRMQAGDSPLQLGPKREESGKLEAGLFQKLTFPLRVILGSAAGMSMTSLFQLQAECGLQTLTAFVCAGFYYFVLPVYMWIKNLLWPKNLPGF